MSVMWVVGVRCGISKLVVVDEEVKVAELVRHATMVALSASLCCDK